MTPVDAILARLLELHPKKIDLSLDRIWRILERLDHPERKVPPVIHVGGTNGKGSVIAFMRAILEASGRRVHVYTSPHLVRFNERFRVGAKGGGTLVSDAELAAVHPRQIEIDDDEGIFAGERALEPLLSVGRRLEHTSDLGCLCRNQLDHLRIVFDDEYRSLAHGSPG